MDIPLKRHEKRLDTHLRGPCRGALRRHLRRHGRLCGLLRQVRSLLRHGGPAGLGAHEVFAQELSIDDL